MHILWVFFFFFLFLPPSYVALWDSKTPHRPAGESVSCCLQTSPSRLPPQNRSLSLTLLSFFLSFIFCPTLLKRMDYLPGCLVSFSSVQNQKLFCVSCWAFKWSFDKFVKEKVVPPSYSSAILGPQPHCYFWIQSIEIQYFISKMISMIIPATIY